MLNWCILSWNIYLTPVHIYFTPVSARSIFNEVGRRTAKLDNFSTLPIFCSLYWQNSRKYANKIFAGPWNHSCHFCIFFLPDVCLSRAHRPCVMFDHIHELLIHQQYKKRTLGNLEQEHQYHRRAEHINWHLLVHGM